MIFGPSLSTARDPAIVAWVFGHAGWCRKQLTARVPCTGPSGWKDTPRYWVGGLPVCAMVSHCYHCYTTSQCGARTEPRTEESASPSPYFRQVAELLVARKTARGILWLPKRSCSDIVQLSTRKCCAVSPLPCVGICAVSSDMPSF